MQLQFFQIPVLISDLDLFVIQVPLGVVPECVYVVLKVRVTLGMQYFEIFERVSVIDPGAVWVDPKASAREQHTRSICM
jgi:hypothetical protein